MASHVQKEMIMSFLSVMCRRLSTLQWSYHHTEVTMRWSKFYWRLEPTSTIKTRYIQLVYITQYEVV